MLTARTVGLSRDGMSLIIATPGGEELALPVDDRLHAALRGDQPRLGQLEIEMENALGPRDIQSRIRAGQSLDEVGRVAGIPLDRVERFAAPVLAEREHVALLAMSSSVRRRGETSGHRLLRVAVTERLTKRGVDIESVDWDSFRLEDGRWSVSADYLSGETNRRAVFLFDLQGRFSVAGNDEARWVLGEQSSLKGPQPGRRRPATQEGEGEADTEPTLDLSDELALVRVVQPAGAEDGAASVGSEGGLAEPGDGRVWAEQELSPTTSGHLGDEVDDEVDDGPSDEDTADQDPPGEHTGGEDELEELRRTGRLATVRDLYAVPDQVEAGDRFGEQPGFEEIPPSQGGSESPLETLASMLDAGQGSDKKDRKTGYAGLSDASAVPETDNRGWEPGIVVDYPVEPSPEPATETAEDEAESTPPDQGLADGRPPQDGPEGDLPTGDSSSTRRGTDKPAPPDPIVDGEDRAEEADAFQEEHVLTPPTARPAPKRKRAAVPSWDEIMFGGPTRSG